MQLNLQAIPPWLDEETSALVRDTAELLAQRHPDVVAIILCNLAVGLVVFTNMVKHSRPLIFWNTVCLQRKVGTSQSMNE